MDYGNERWIRVYTRDTTTWKLIDWRARTVLLHLLRKVDRAGVLDVGEDGIDGLAAVLELPIGEVVEPGLHQLVTRGTVVATGAAYVIPNFITAQEAPSSDRQRQKDARERRRATALSRDDSSQNVTPESRNVTERHAESQGVTPRHAVSLQTRQEVTRGDETRGICEPVAPRPANGNTGLFGMEPEKPAKQRRGQRVPMPADFRPDASVVSEARTGGVDLDREIAKLRDWSTSKGEYRVDWQATARNWIRSAADRQGPGARASPARAAPASSIDATAQALRERGFDQ